MGERSMATCLEEQLEVMREAARLHSISVCGYTLQQWYDEGADLKIFLDNEDVIGGDDGLETVTKTTYAWGYLEGAADMADVTVLELLDSDGLTFDAAPKRQKKTRTGHVSGS